MRQTMVPTKPKRHNHHPCYGTVFLCLLICVVQAHSQTTSETATVPTPSHASLLLPRVLQEEDLDQDGYTSDVDCDDNDASVFPGAAELCGDGIDNNCNNAIDEQPCLRDADADSFFVLICNTTVIDPVICQDYKSLHLPNHTVDCNDTNADINPNAEENCGGLIDKNCDGVLTRCPSQLPSSLPTVDGQFLTLRPTATARPTAPSAFPSSLPSAFSSLLPSALPSALPSKFPTSLPSKLPSSLPSKFPSKFPSAFPSKFPSSLPSAFPSAFPSAWPSSIPSQVPSESPTIAPSATPSLAPSIKLSNMPTQVPSRATSSPSKQPQGSTIVTVTETLRDIKLTLGGLVQQMDEGASAAFGSSLANMNIDFYTSDRRRLEAKGIIYDYWTSVEVTRQTLLVSSSSLDVYYNQYVTYKQPDTAKTTPENTVMEPFTSEASVDKFAADLKSKDDAFSTLESISSPDIPDQDTLPAPSPGEISDGNDSEDDPVSMGVVIACAAGGVALLLIVFAAVTLRKPRMHGEHHEPLPTAVEPPRKSAEAGASRSGDEISMVSDPITFDEVKSSIGRGDQSIETVDYDYSKAYGGGENSVVSSAGGTMGENTRATGAVSERLQPDRAALGASFDSETNSNRPDPTVQEQIIEIFAPPGKLGVVIDTPDSGPPVVHAVKDSSVIGGLICVGDQLIMVDDIDVSNMTAIKVSKLISKKSANPKRKLTIVRKVST